jgi:capsular exopolysaccharide synthesis family protein
MMTPKYEAVSTIVVNKESSDLLGLESLASAVSSASDSVDYTTTLQTQANALQSDSLAFQVAEQLGLERRKEFSITPSRSNSDEIAKELKLPLEQAPLRRERIRSVFKKNLKIKPISGTRLIEVHFQSSDPQIAAAIVNCLVNDYLEEYFHTRSVATAQVSDWLSKQLADVKSQVDDSQQKLNQVQKESGLLGQDEANNVVMTKLDDLNKQLTAAQADRILKQTVYELVKSGNPELLATAPSLGLANGASNGGSSNSLALVQTLRAQEAQLKVQYAQAATKYGSAYPALVEMRNQLQELDNSIQSELQKVAGRAANDYSAAQKAEGALRSAFDQQKAAASQLNDKAVEYNLLKGEVESGSKLYDDLLTKLREGGVLSALRSSNVVVLDPARSAAKPKTPNKPLNLAIGLGTGFLLGIALAFTREALDDKVYTPEQVSTIVALPYVGIVPKLSTNWPIRRFLPFFGKPSSTGIDILSNPSSPLAEAFRSFRASVLLASVDAPPKVIAITSALPQEGKTTASLNSALALALQGAKVLLIEADLRKPSLSQWVKTDTSTGLSGALADPSTDEPQFIQHPQIANLQILPAGEMPSNPAEMLGSRRMRDCINGCRRKFDFIVIDTPPLLIVSDAVVISRYADAVVMVVCAEQTTKRSVEQARDILQQARAPLTGILINQFDENSYEYRRYRGYSASKYGKEYYAKVEGNKPATEVSFDAEPLSESAWWGVRQYPRYHVHFPLTVTVERAEGSETLRGIATTLGKGGLGARLDGQLAPGEVVQFSTPDPHAGIMLPLHAEVCYGNGSRYGFSFLDITAEEQDGVERFCHAEVA